MELKEYSDYWHEHEAKRMQMEPGAVSEFRRAFSKQIATFTTALSQSGRVDAGSTLLTLYITPEPMQIAYRNVYRSIGLQFANRSYNRIMGAKKNEILENNWFMYFDNWVMNNAGDMIVGINETTRNLLRTVLVNANQEGLGVFETINAIMQVWPEIERYRAERIARTESVTAANLGSIQGAEATGLALNKRWVATMDNRTRDAHLEADGQTVAMHSDFVINGESAEYPGDPSLSAGERINCRCTQIFVPI
jgi:hypothetical protein